MRIGIDFDNTIVSYDALFHKVALEQDVIPPDTPQNKLAVRNHLRKAGKEDVWTEMQGYVYGARMAEAASYPGALDCMRRAACAGHVLAIVSHKTAFPFLGPKHDLHAAARSWIEHHLHADGAPLVPPSQIFFELTKDEKLARIGTFGCDLFIDDLPEILSAPAFPSGTRRILFDPEAGHQGCPLPINMVCRSWPEIETLLTQ